MKVFLSSVTYALRAERDGLAAQLRVIPPYEVTRFEDFTAQDRSSREACLAGVEACDVYVLLLGPRYGDPLPDTDKAPTEEEFELARRLGKKILVFVKEINEVDEPRQAMFKARVQSYVNGYFRDAFTDTLSLNLAVTAALREVSLSPARVEWSLLAEPAPLIWRWQVSMVQDRSIYGPILDVHLVPVDGPLLRASELQALPSLMTRRARGEEFFAETDPVEAGSDASAAWAWVRERSGNAGVFSDRRVNEHRGLLVHRSGQVTAFEALPTDFMGALVDRPELQRRLSRLVRVASDQLPPSTTDVALAASLAPLDHVYEGDPSKVGGRHQGTLRLSAGAAAVMNPVSKVPVRAIRDLGGDVAAEMGAELLDGLRSVR